jgi:SAM-dependent methyltransferase
MANHMLYHAPDLRRAIAELCRVLRPGGWLFAATNGPTGLREIQALLRQVRPDAEPFSFTFGLHNGAEAFRPYLSEVQVLRYPNRLEVTDPEAVVGYIASTGAGRGLSQSEHEVIRQESRREIEARGHFAVTIDTGVITGRRVVRGTLPFPALPPSC